MESVWKKYSKNFEVNNTANATCEKDIVIIGGGIAGMLCAYFLSGGGHEVTVIDKGKVLNGVTVNTTAHINALQGNFRYIYKKRKKLAALYFQSQLDAVNIIEGLIDKYQIDCDFKRVDSYLYADKTDDLRKEYKAVKKLKMPAEYLENVKLPFFNGETDAVLLKNQAVFNPLKFLNALPQKYEIIENVKVKDVNLGKKIIYTGNYTIHAQKIIIATNFPIVNKRGLYAFKMYKSQSYAINIKTDKIFNDIYMSVNKSGLTFREGADGVIIGGLDHRTGRHKCGAFDKLTEAGGFLNGEVTNKWAANDCITFDNIPLAGYFCENYNDIFLISGFNKWGMTNSVISAKIIGDIINKRENKYIKVFSPERPKTLKILPVFLFNALYNVSKILCALFTRKKCPHMGCKLKFNPNTSTWDCPCHGSRFEKDGEIITCPAVEEFKP